MVIKTKIAAKVPTAVAASRTTATDPTVVVVSSASPAARARAPALARLTPERSRSAREAEADDVIDLGAPRQPRRGRPARRPARLRTAYTPNPRLYPGPGAKTKRRSERTGGETRGRHRKRAFLRPVPNSRLYRPAPRRPPPPPVAPRAAWPPPAPPAHLDTASRAALRLAEQRRAPPPSAPPEHSSSPSPRSPRRGPPPLRCCGPRSSPLAPPTPQLFNATRLDPAGRRRLVVTLPWSPARGETPRRYRPASEHFRLRSPEAGSGESTPPAAAARRPRGREPAMETGNRPSISPEDRSEGNETLSAPSEFLAEFLSAIMRRQYAEALKYCRLILQYEPHNATARGFYPLLQHKVQGEPAEGDEVRGGSSEEASAAAAGASRPAPRAAQEPMEQGGDESDRSEPECGGSCSASRTGSRGSVGSQSSLELDSSEPLAHSSPSLSSGRRTEHSDSAASGGRWDSSGSEPDDNGNAPHLAPAACDTHQSSTGDSENDNAAAAGEPPRARRAKSEAARAAASLQRLRAQFACSIK